MIRNLPYTAATTAFPLSELAEASPAYVKAGGHCAVEIGAGQAEDVIDIFCRTGSMIMKRPSRITAVSTESYYLQEKSRL